MTNANEKDLLVRLLVKCLYAYVTGIFLLVSEKS